MEVKRRGKSSHWSYNRFCQNWGKCDWVRTPRPNKTELSLTYTYRSVALLNVPAVVGRLDGWMDTAFSFLDLHVYIWRIPPNAPVTVWVPTLHKQFGLLKGKWRSHYSQNLSHSPQNWSQVSPTALDTGDIYYYCMFAAESSHPCFCFLLTIGGGGKIISK